jgi:hypothetical protein
MLDQASKAHSNQFVWRVDLQSLGYPTTGTEIQSQRGLNEFDTVDFVSENTVVATFVTKEALPTQTRDTAVHVPPYRLHALFIDASNGTVLKTLEWPVNNLHSGIFPRYDGSFVFFSTERIVLYSADWMELKEIPLSTLTSARAFLAGIAESPSGKTILIHFIQNQSVGCIRILTATLDHSEDSCRLPSLFSVSDEETAFGGLTDMPKGTPLAEVKPKEYPLPSPDCIGGRPCPIPGPTPVPTPVYKVLIGTQGSPARILCDTSNDAGCQTPQFLSDQFLVVYDRYAFSIMDHSGEQEWEIKLDRTSDMIPIAEKPIHTSANGLRFAVVISEPSLPQGQFPEYMPSRLPKRVDIYDPASGRRIYTVENEKHQFKEVWGLALSPAGEKLVIDSGGVIQMYALPRRSN